MAELGLRAYRFSVSWPRIQPEGRGAPNERGLDHYRRLVDSLNERGIAPILTLFHWDLPQAVQDAGGWPARDTAERFAEYAAIVHDALAGDVSRWITLNEPWVAAWLGYGEGIHAPGHRDVGEALAATHHLLLAHGLAVEAMAEPQVGIALNLEPHRPARDTAEDRRAAVLTAQHMNDQFLGPVFGQGYPEELTAHYLSVSDMSFVRDGDLERIAHPIAFLGVNYYRPQIVTADPSTPGVIGPVVGDLGARSVVPSGTPVTAMGWPIDPSGLSELLAWIRETYGAPRILITENGAAFDDVPGEAGTVDDVDRIAYLDAHLGEVRRAISAGSPVEGYLVWSFLDNFEWAQGYSKRFGLVHVDYPTQRRTPKASAGWFSDVVRSNGRTVSVRA
jgi:beta-glucosidase